MSDPAQTITTDPVEAMLAQASLKHTLFAATSRYYGVDTGVITLEGRATVYLRRRFVPSPDRFQLLQEHVVTEGERLDNITARYLGDPTLFWRLCDANNAMRPDELTEATGRRLKITMPEGIAGAPL